MDTFKNLTEMHIAIGLPVTCVTGSLSAKIEHLAMAAIEKFTAGLLKIYIQTELHQ